MKLTDDQFGASVSTLYSLWSEAYRVAFKKKRPKARLDYYKIKLKDQLEFVKLYLGFLMIDGNNKANLKRIMNFLMLQKVTSKGKLEIHLVGGSPLEVIVHVNNLEEIDFADTQSLIGYDSIHILRRDKKWTKRSADTITSEIKDDLEFDHYTFNPTSIDIYNRDHDNELAFIDCKIKEE